MLPSDKLTHSLNDPHEEALATDGEYSRYYDTLGSIGRGAFGFVKMAQHKELPDLMVIRIQYMFMVKLFNERDLVVTSLLC